MSSSIRNAMVFADSKATALFFLWVVLFIGSHGGECYTIHVRQDGCNTKFNDASNKSTCLESLEDALELPRLVEGASEGIEVLLYSNTLQQPYVLETKVTTFVQINNFTLRGLEGGADIHCKSGVGLAFVNSTGISFKNVRFISCGALRNSTSRDLSNRHHPSFLTFRAALYFLFCADITMQNVVVSQSDGTGVVLYSTVGHNTFSDSVFQENVASADYRGGGGGVTVEFVFCIPGEVTCFEKDESSSPQFFSSNATYNFSNCTFLQNRATTTNYSATAFTSSFKSYHVALGRGGGLSVFFKGEAQENSIAIVDCNFFRNEAVWGGGILADFEDSSTNNLLLIKSTVFEDNSCQYMPLTYNGTGGGGARISFAGFNGRVEENNVMVESVQFKNNRAYFGGGVSFHTVPEDDRCVATNSIEFLNCSWTHNVARLGSALDLASYQEMYSSAVVIPVLTNGVFDSNSVRYSNYSGIAAGFGTIYADHVPLVFNESFNSQNNFGSSIVSLNAELRFTPYCVANFTNNTGYSGGAVALYGSGFVRVGDSTMMHFTGNRAELNGGAIFWQSEGNHELISSRNCFIRYSVRSLSPYKWPVRFVFLNNSAGLFGNSIYATTLLTCLWGGVPFGELLPPTEEYGQVFCWNGEQLIWDYGDDNCSTSIATSPGYFTGADRPGRPYMSSIFPGQTLQLPVRMEDDRGHTVPDRGLAFTWMADGQQHGYVNREISVAHDEPRGTVTITLDTVQPRVLTANIILDLSQCPTGFVFNHTTLSCTAGVYRFFRTGLNYSTFIQRGYWIGYNQDRTALIAAQCFHCGFNPMLPTEDYTPLPKDPNDLDDFFCGSLNRTGVTCSRCRNGTGSAVNSRYYPCVECPENVTYYSWLLFLLTEFAPNTILLILVVLFNVSVTSGPANAFIFYAQVISTTFGVDANGVIPFESITPAADTLREVYTAIYDIWNLNFFYAVSGWQFCLSPNLQALHLAVIAYITALYPLLVLLLILVVAILYDRQNRVVTRLIRPLHHLVSRVRHRWNFHRSITDAFATFVVLSFSKVAVNSQNILFPNSVYDSNGTEITTVALLNGELEIRSNEYLPYFILAMTVFIFTCFIIPVVMLLYSIKPFYSCLNKLKLTFLLPGEKFKYFLNAFHFCYKDGTDGTYDLRFFAALYFILRVLLIWTYGLAPTWTQQYVMQQVICTVGVLLFGVLQPYKKPFYNFLDSAFFALLATINILTMFNRYREAADLPLSAPAYWIEILLIFSPLLYITGFLIYYFYQANKDSIKKLFHKVCYRKEEDNGRIRSVSRFRALTGHKEGRSLSNVDDGFGDFMDQMVMEGEWRSTTSYYGPPREDQDDPDYRNDTELPQPIHAREVGHSSFSITENCDDRLTSFHAVDRPLSDIENR